MAKTKPLFLTCPAASVVLAVSLLVPSGCSPHSASDVKEAYYVDPNSNVHYQFADASGTHFGANCHDQPVLVLGGGDYPWGTKQFELTVDERSWNLEAYDGKHGKALIVTEPTIVDAVANAKRGFTFSVGEWKRTLRPSPKIAQWLANCRDRKAASATLK